MIKCMVIAGTLALSAAGVQASPVCDVADVREAMEQSVGPGEMCVAAIELHGLQYAADTVNDECRTAVKYMNVVQAASLRVNGYDCTVFRNQPSEDTLERFKAMVRRFRDVLGVTQ